ncbi:MAG TPA: hypothetical protein VIO61_15515 [Anaerolineaceae bacterium]
MDRTLFWKTVYALSGNAQKKLAQPDLTRLPFPLQTAVIQTVVEQVSPTNVIPSLEQQSLSRKQQTWERFSPPVLSIRSIVKNETVLPSFLSIIEDFCREYPTYLQYAFQLLFFADIQSKSNLAVRYELPSFGLITTALFDALTMLENGATLFDHPFSLTKVTLIIDQPLRENSIIGRVHQRLLHNYLRSGSLAEDHRVDPTKTRISLTFIDEWDQSSPVDSTISINQAETPIIDLSLQISGNPDLSSINFLYKPECLDVFARRIFPIKEFTDAQHQMFRDLWTQDKPILLVPGEDGQYDPIQLYALVSPHRICLVLPDQESLKKRQQLDQQSGITWADRWKIEDKNLEPGELMYLAADESLEYVQTEGFAQLQQAFIWIFDRGDHISYWNLDFSLRYRMVFIRITQNHPISINSSFVLINFPLKPVVDDIQSHICSGDRLDHWKDLVTIAPINGYAHSIGQLSSQNLVHPEFIFPLPICLSDFWHVFHTKLAGPACLKPGKTAKSIFCPYSPGFHCTFGLDAWKIQQILLSLPQSRSLETLFSQIMQGKPTKVNLTSKKTAIEWLIWALFDHGWITAISIRSYHHSLVYQAKTTILENTPASLDEFQTIYSRWINQIQNLHLFRLAQRLAVFSIMDIPATIMVSQEESLSCQNRLISYPPDDAMNLVDSLPITPASARNDFLDALAVLDSDPDNLAALLLAGKASHLLSRYDEAADYLHYGFRRCITSPNSRKHCCSFLKEVITIRPDIVVDWLLEDDEPWQDFEGTRGVIKEAILKVSQVIPVDNISLRTLLTRYKVKSWRMITQSLSMSKQLLQELRLSPKE